MSLVAPSPADLADASRRAAARIRGIVRETPLERSAALGDAVLGEVWLKLEHLQHTGSFKLRGAAAKLTALDEDARRRGVVTASTGNHGLAVTYASTATGAAAPRVHVPANADAGKIARLRAAGAEVVVSGASCAAAEEVARADGAANGRAYVSPYNDEEVAAGQGTLGLELVAPGGPAFDTVYVAVGGGGLVAGVAAAVKAARPGVRVIGCLPENSPGMLASVRAGRIVEAPELPTLSDATAGGVEPGAITFDLCRALVDDWVTVTEEQIRAGFRALFDAERWIVEGAAAVAFAGLRAAAKPGERSVVVLCGRNASAAQIATLFG